MSNNRNKARWRSSMRHISIGAHHHMQSSRILSGAQSRQTSLVTILPHTHTHTHTHTHIHTHTHTHVHTGSNYSDGVLPLHRLYERRSKGEETCRKAVQSLKWKTGFGVLS